MRIAITGRPSGDTIYAQLLRDSDGSVWDAVGEAWVTRSSSTPGAAIALPWDATDLQHAASLDVAPAHPSPDEAEFSVLLYKQLAGSPNVATDLLVGGYPVTLQSGQPVLHIAIVAIEFSAAIDGSDIALQAWLTTNDVTLDLATIDPAATCSIVLKEQTSGIELLNETTSTITADNHFELTVVDAVDETNADKNYFARVTITVLGIAHVRELPLTTAG